ncbi:MAG: PEP-CTERM sorting domain-containing protein [Solirubrobacterales bacterium]
MKSYLSMMGAALLLTTPLLAENSLHFSTREGSAYAWELAWTGTQWELSFVDDAIVVDDAVPTDSVLMGDRVLLPTMTVSSLTNLNNMLTATLTPTEAFRIQSDTDGTTVLSATMKSGSMLAVGTNTVAYSQPSNDLTVGSYTENYSTVLSGLVSDEKSGLMLDLSFSGDAIQGANLYNILRGKTGSATGTVCGQISSIPEPATLLILGLGVVIANQFRPRQRKA